MEVKITYRGRRITDSDVLFLRDLITRHPAACRNELSRLLAEAWNWRQENGFLRDMVARGLMLALHRQGEIELPPPRLRVRNPFLERKKPTFVAIDKALLRAQLSEIQPVEMRQVRRTR